MKGDRGQFRAKSQIREDVLGDELDTVDDGETCVGKHALEALGTAGSVADDGETAIVRRRPYCGNNCCGHEVSAASHAFGCPGGGAAQGINVVGYDEGQARAGTEGFEGGLDARATGTIPVAVDT